MAYPVERFLSIRAAHGGSLSPDGAELAFITNITGLPQAWAVPVRGGWPRQISFTADAVRELRWSPAGDWILFTMDTKGDERAQLHLVRPDGGEPLALTEQPAAMHVFGDWSADGRRISYSSNERDERYFDVYVMDVATRETRRVVEQDDNNYAGGFSPDGRRLLYLQAHGSLDYDLFVVDLETGERVCLTPHDGAATIAAPRWEPDGQGVLLLTDIGSDLVYLARVDLHSRRLAPEIQEDWDVEGLAVCCDGRLVAYTLNRGGRSEVLLGPLGQERPVDGLPEGVAGNLRFSADGRCLSFDYDGPTHPFDCWVCDTATGTARQVTHSDTAGIPRWSFVEPELVSYPTFDEHLIPAWWYLPEAPPETGAPVVLWIHGGPESQTRADFNPVIQFLVHRGYAVLAPNVRGSTGYGRAYHQLDNGRLRMNSVRDAAQAVDWLRAGGVADPARIVCLGGSYGGFMVLSLVTTYPDLWAAGIDLFGIANFITFFEKTGPYRRKLRASEYGDPDTEADFLREISPINHVEQIRCPMLVIQGATDPRVPQAESDQMVEQLRARGVPVEYLVFEDEGHGLLKLANRITAYAAVAEFLDRHLG